MKVFTNAAMLVVAVALMGWLLTAQQAYQQTWSGNSSVQPGSADDTSLATSMNRAMLALG